LRIWKFIGSLVVIGVLASAAFASAAKLNLNSQGVQAGNAIVGGCQGDAAVGVSYGTHYDNSISAFLIDTVTVSGIADACLSTPSAPRATEVVLTFGPPAGGSQYLGLKTILGSSVVYSLPPGSQPSVSDLTDVHVLIK
jgi:hypothetical protein